MKPHDAIGHGAILRDHDMCEGFSNRQPVAAGSIALDDLKQIFKLILGNWAIVRNSKIDRIGTCRCFWEAGNDFVGQLVLIVRNGSNRHRAAFAPLRTGTYSCRTGFWGRLHRFGKIQP